MPVSHVTVPILEVCKRDIDAISQWQNIYVYIQTIGVHMYQSSEQSIPEKKFQIWEFVDWPGEVGQG